MYVCIGLLLFLVMISFSLALFLILFSSHMFKFSVYWNCDHLCFDSYFPTSIGCAWFVYVRWIYNVRRQSRKKYKLRSECVRLDDARAIRVGYLSHFWGTALGGLNVSVQNCVRECVWWSELNISRGDVFVYTCLYLPLGDSSRSSVVDLMNVWKFTALRDHANRILLWNARSACRNSTVLYARLMCESSWCVSEYVEGVLCACVLVFACSTSKQTSRIM